MMDRRLYLSDRFGAVEENGRLVEYIPTGNRDEAGRILTGRVERIMSGLDAAFVDIGRSRAGFLPLKENSSTFTEGPIRSGDRILVQIRREETGNKGCALTRDLSIPGSYLILMPRNRHIGVSARIHDGKIREKMLRWGRELAENRHGLVMRESAVHADPEEVRRELEQLRSAWNGIREGRVSAETPEEELKRDYTPKGISQVLQVEELPQNLLRQLKEAEARSVRLPHGGNIVIDRCEALTVIDVNSASDSGEGNRRETVLRTNLEACREIMIQVRLRNLSGILILDLIDMEDEADKQKVRESLEEDFREDRKKTVIHGYTSLGLMEMTRKRDRNSWVDQQNA